MNDIFLLEQICNDDLNVAQYIIEKYNIEEENAENQLILLDTATTYMNGDIDEKHTQKFIKECIALLEDKNKIKTKNFFTEWEKNMEKNNFDFKYNLLNKLLSNSKDLYIFTEFIWSFKSFRNLICKFKYHDSAQDFVEHGIFKNMFSNSAHNYKINDILKCYDALIKDEEIHSSLIKYIYQIVKLNESFSSINYIVTTTQKKCSKLDFNIFIVKLLNEIYKNKKDIILSSINRDISSYVVDYNVNSNVNSNYDLTLHENLYITYLYGLRIVLCCVEKMYDMGRTDKTKKYIRAIKKIVCEEFIQDAFIDYMSVFKFVKLEQVFEDCVNYYDFVIAYNEKDEFNIKIKKDFYGLMSNILGGIDGNIKNHNIRLSTFTIIKATADKIGFNSYAGFFDNLFKYINEIDYSKIGSSNMHDKFSHHHSITQILLQMTDICSSINDKSKYIFPETIYRLISNSFEYFDLFDDKLYGEIKGGTFKDIKCYLEAYYDVLEASLYTILIYNNLYEKKITNIIYPELEEKMIFFIGRILKNAKMTPGNKFMLKNHSTITKFLVPLCFAFIHKRINSDIEIIFEIKEQLLESLNIYNYENKDKIHNIIENYKKLDDFPQDFMDPLTCKFIKKPVMIPNTNEIFDRTTIMSQIYSQGINPYTREKLSLEILEEYNAKEDIMKKITDFENNKKNWEKFKN